jgi:hypothetical protein
MTPVAEGGLRRNRRLTPPARLPHPSNVFFFFNPRSSLGHVVRVEGLHSDAVVGVRNEHS